MQQRKPAAERELVDHTGAIGPSGGDRAVEVAVGAHEDWRFHPAPCERIRREGVESGHGARGSRL